MEKAASQQYRKHEQKAKALPQLNISHTQRLAGIGSLTAGVIQELTNPLSIISAACDNLRYELAQAGNDQASIAYFLDLIEENAGMGFRMVEVLRNYADLAELQMSVTSVEMIVQDTLALLERNFLHEANTPIEVDMPAGLHSLVCDHHRLMQVLVTLLTNARDAMQPRGGQIHLVIHELKKEPERVNGDKQPANGSAVPLRMIFAVRDSGKGIDPDVMDQLFKPFFSTKPFGQGAGLGLFVAQSIINQHQGRIWAENNAGSQPGATFTFVLPQQPSLPV